MKNLFSRFNNAFKNDQFDEFVTDQKGIYFLKFRSLNRKNILEQIAAENNIDIKSVPSKNLFEFLFHKNISEDFLNEFIRRKYLEERNQRKSKEDLLYSQLYRIKEFDWGGFYQNSVEQTIVNNYIKKIDNYNELVSCIDDNLSLRIRKYIICSWYNHWTSILIEDLFKEHPDILPTLGKIKKVDFFWKNFPFDLKVTYFPVGYMEMYRKQKGWKPYELSELKSFAKTEKIFINRSLSEQELFDELLTRISESSSKKAKEFLISFYAKRKVIIDDAIANPKNLIRWLYENQGIRRFDAANRFFIILIDKNHLEESWKLKRNKEILSKSIKKFLDKNRSIDFEKLKLSFTWEEKTYQVFSTCLFILQ